MAPVAVGAPASGVGAGAVAATPVAVGVVAAPPALKVTLRNTAFEAADRGPCNAQKRSRKVALAGVALAGIALAGVALAGVIVLPVQFQKWMVSTQLGFGRKIALAGVEVLQASAMRADLFPNDALKVRQGVSMAGA